MLATYFFANLSTDFVQFEMQITSPGVGKVAGARVL